MSLESWKKEFYPIEAKSTMRMDAIGIIKHSLQKWKGLGLENLNRHGLVRGRWIHNVLVIRETGLSNQLKINDSSCSLCKKYCDYDELEDEDQCLKCPIYKMRGSDCIGEYLTFKHHGNESHMVELLESTLKHAEIEAMEKENRKQKKIDKSQNQVEDMEWGQ